MSRAIVGAVLLCALASCLDSNDDDDGTPVRPDARVVDAFDAAVQPDAIVDAGATDAAGPAIIVTPTSGLITTEAGGTDSFEIVLATEPTGAVGISIVSLDATEVAVDPSSMVFSVKDWFVPVPITVTGVADGVVDGDQVVTIEVRPASSLDPDYSDRDPDDVSVTNLDVD